MERGREGRGREGEREGEGERERGGRGRERERERGEGESTGPTGFKSRLSTAVPSLQDDQGLHRNEPIQMERATAPKCPLSRNCFAKNHEMIIKCLVFTVDYFPLL